MSSNSKSFLAVFVIVLVLAGGLIFFASRSKSNTISADSNPTSEAGEKLDSGYIERLAKFLNEKGMVMYGAYWCSHCKQQKEAFGDAFQYVDYVECDAKGPNPNPDECAAQGITGYPTWIYQGKQYSGFQDLSKLAQIVGFVDEQSTTPAVTAPATDTTGTTSNPNSNPAPTN